MLYIKLSKGFVTVSGLAMIIGITWSMIQAELDSGLSILQLDGYTSGHHDCMLLVLIGGAVWLVLLIIGLVYYDKGCHEISGQ